MNRRISVRAIVFRDGKLLCVRLKDYQSTFKPMLDEWWCLPGGGLDEHEALIDGLKREMLEETGIKADVGNLLYIQQFATPDSNTEHLEFFFHVANAADFQTINLSKTSHGESEIAEIKFVDSKSTTILPDLLTTDDIAAKIRANASPTLFNLLANKA